MIALNKQAYDRMTKPLASDDYPEHSLKQM